VTGESAVSPSPSQRPSHRKEATAECARGLDLGRPCMLPADPATGLCQRHDPARADERRFQALQAARVSHAPRALRLFGPEWADPDFKSAEARIAFREAVAGARGRGELDDRSAITLLRACADAAADDPPQKSAAAPPLVVEVARFSPGAEPEANGQEPA
jgi:hypothetical protein